MPVEVIFALVVVGLLFVGSAIAAALLMDEVTMTDEHDALFNRFEY